MGNECQLSTRYGDPADRTARPCHLSGDGVRSIKRSHQPIVLRLNSPVASGGMFDEFVAIDDGHMAALALDAGGLPQFFQRVGHRSAHRTHFPDKNSCTCGISLISIPTMQTREVQTTPPATIAEAHQIGGRMFALVARIQSAEAKRRSERASNILNVS